MQIHTLRNDLREAYDKHAQERDSGPMEDWKIAERSAFLSALQREKKKRLLEVGAGTGRDGKFFQDQGFDVLCIDLSPAMIELCRQKGLAAHVMDMAGIDLPGNSFDAVYSMNSMLHLAKAEFPKVLQRIAALLRPGGMFYLGMYGGHDDEGIWEEDPYTPKRFFSLFTDEHLKEEVTKVFDVLVFNCVTLEPDISLHFQSLILKKQLTDQTAG